MGWTVAAAEQAVFRSFCLFRCFSLLSFVSARRRRKKKGERWKKRWKRLVVEGW